MYRYNLIIKTGAIMHADALVNRELVKRFGPDVHYHKHAMLTNEAVIIVSHDSKRTLQSVLGDWFAEDANHEAPYPEGALLHYRELVSGDRPGDYA
jgi:hypothetical protein